MSGRGVTLQLALPDVRLRYHRNGIPRWAFVVLLAVARPVLAAQDAAPDQQADVPAGKPGIPAFPPPFRGTRLALDVSFEYGFPVSDVYGLQIDPFSLGIGGRVSWAIPAGLWFGARGAYFFGSAHDQTYTPSFSTTSVDLTAQADAASLGVEIGFDLSLPPLVLRYSLDVGATFFSWDLGDIPYFSLAGYSPMRGSTVGAHLAPGIGVFVPLDPFFLGLEYAYRVELDSQIPNAMNLGLHTGWRL